MSTKPKAIGADAASGRRVPAVGRASRDTLREQIYEKLRKALMSGKFVPGQATRIRGLAAELGTSPIPVREALHRLIAERAFEALPNGSIVVPIMTRPRFEDLRRARILIEGFATELAAAAITDKELERLGRAHEAGVAAARHKDGKAFLAKNMEFRFIIYRAARSPVLLPVIESFWLQFGPFLNFAFAEQAVSFGLGHHTKALAALRRRDGKAARAAIEADITETGEYIMNEAIPLFDAKYGAG
jgi:DNA-binding GntR family transcriptional regulator